MQQCNVPSNLLSENLKLADHWIQMSLTNVTLSIGLHAYNLNDMYFWTSELNKNDLFDYMLN